MTHLPSTALFTTLLALTSCAVEDPGVAAFSQRVDRYVKLREQARNKVGALPTNASAEEIEKHGQAIIAELRSARSNAQPGDVFVPDARTVFLHTLKTHLSGAENQEIRTSARQGNPERQKEPGDTLPQVQVNAVYPASAPLSTVPPKLLHALPKLPKDIDYRFCGQSLLILDTESSLIIDYIEGAAPAL